ncbi:hypothetical protein PtB15_1B916 [Puccinia triticina]|nr:hypothetical protein PtB15_1B916 [Puccinia triticina]
MSLLDSAPGQPGLFAPASSSREPSRLHSGPRPSGETSKPDGWPRGIVHREPDDLLKPDRIKRMLAVLGAGRVSVGRLGLASAETAVFIPPPDKSIDLLRDIYTVAKEEERRRAASPAPFFHTAIQPLLLVVVPSVELSGAPPSKSSRSPPTTSTSDILTASPTTIDDVANAESASDAAVGFLGTAPADHETCHPHMFPGCLSNIEPASFAHESSPGLLSGEYGGDSWPTTPDAFHASMAAPRQPKRSGRSVLEDVDSLTATSGRQAWTEADAACAPDRPLFPERSTHKNSAWADGGAVFGIGGAGECAQNWRRNGALPPTAFDAAEAHSQESYLL